MSNKPIIYWAKVSLSLPFMVSTILATCPLSRANGTYYANSPSYADVNDCINGSGINTCHAGSPTGAQATHTAANGDVINVPAGSATWNSELLMTSGKCFTLIGSGTPNNLPTQYGAGTVNTTITLNVQNSFQIAMNPDAATCGTNVMRLSTFKFVRGSIGSSPVAPIYANGYVCTSTVCPQVRIDNIIADSNWCTSPATPAAAFIVAWNFFGVIDHNTIGGSSPTCPNNGLDFVNVGHGWYLNGTNSSKYGDNSFAQPDSLGSAKNVFLENNKLLGQAFLTDTDYPSPYQSGTLGAWSGGGRYVVRFNQVTATGGSAVAGNHGTESTGRTRGARQEEYYGNNITCTNVGGCNAFGARSGVWITFNNILGTSASGFWGNVMTLNDYRTHANFNPWGGCFGSPTNGPFDTNDGTTYYSGTASTTSSTALTDNSQTWTATFGSSSWWSSAANGGTPYSIYDTTQGFGAEIANVHANVITFKQNPICNWGTGAACTIKNGDAYTILRATACLDQPGRGTGALIKDTAPGNGIPALSSSRAVGQAKQALDPGYEWGDSTPARINAVVSSSSTNRIIANRDWYQENQNQTAQTSQTSPFNGTGDATHPGVGHGTKANRPSTCTTGNAYWATNEGSWNTTVAANTSGNLYICVANAWPASPSYTPYTYPHPLIGSGPPQAPR